MPLFISAGGALAIAKFPHNKDEFRVELFPDLKWWPTNRFSSCAALTEMEDQELRWECFTHRFWPGFNS
jgi:hypothetical protein